MADAAKEEQQRRIMVAVDEGDESVYALTWCLKNVVVSHNSKDTLILLYAKPPRALYTPYDGTGLLFSTDIIESMERYGREVADCVMEKAKRTCKDIIGDEESLTVEAIVEDGDPRDVICQMVDKHAVDLLVMGSHGYGIIKRAFLGSVSNHCAQNVKCPVLIVKKPKTTVGNIGSKRN